MEKTRLNREHKDRKSDRMVNKASPWHDPQPENSLKKISLQSGIATPSQVGLELEPKKPGEKSSLELRQSLTPTKLAKDSPESLPGEPQQGRPKMSKDSTKRKTKDFAPQTGAKLSIWASGAQEKISSIINPIMLEFYSKKNLRSLSHEEIKELENLKTGILFNLKPFCTINKECLTAKISDIDSKIIEQYSVWLKQVASTLGRELTVDDQKQAKANFYTYLNTEEN